MSNEGKRLGWHSYILSEVERAQVRRIVEPALLRHAVDADELRAVAHSLEAIELSNQVTHEAIARPLAD